jgi:YVTN family beta-propeller protein
MACMFKLTSLNAYELFLLITCFVLYLSISEHANGQEATPDNNSSAINVGSYPVGIKMNPITDRIYVANEYSNTISVIDGSTDLVESTIKVENFPYDVDINPFNNRIYVTNRGSDSVSVIDGSTNTKLTNITVGSSPVGVVINPSANWIYVTNINSKSVSVIDGISNTVVETIPISGIPYAIDLNPLTNRIYVSDIGNNVIVVIDGSTNKIIASVPVGDRPSGISVNIPQNLVYVANYLSNSISIVNGTNYQTIKNIPVGKSPVGIAMNPVSNKIYVSNIGDNTISIIDARRNIKLDEISLNHNIQNNANNTDPILNLPVKVQFPLIASHVTVNIEKNIIYVTNTASNTVTILDGKTDSVVVRINFKVKPENAGTIECNNKRVEPPNSYLFANDGNSRCVAIPASGYAFDHWSNSIASTDNPVSFDVVGFGGITANFKSTLSLEQYLFMILGSIGTTSILAGVYYRRKERKYLKRYMNRIDATYDNLNESNRLECIRQLENTRREITESFKKGTINDSHYNILDKKIFEYLQKLYQQS